MAKSVYTNDQVIDQIDSGLRWTSGGSTAASITYGITTNDSWFPSNLLEYAGWSALNSTQITATIAAMELWTDLIAVDVTAAADPNSADIRISNTTTGISYAHAYYPGTTNSDGWVSQIAQGSIWLNPFYSTLSDPNVGEYGFMAIAHEIGHAFGLSHPGSYNGGSPSYATDAVYAQDTHQYTVMSYFTANNTGADWWAGNGVWQWAQTPMLHDILAIQSIYGADMATRVGDTFYGFNSNAANAVFDFTQNLNPVLTIWDGGGTDTLDLSGWSMGSTISLIEGTFSSGNWMTQNIAIAYGTQIENAVGGTGDDVITGNAADNVLDGGEGGDIIFGLVGADIIHGGEGNDTLFGDDASGFIDNVIDFGADQIFGGPGNDNLFAEGGFDFIDGGADIDLLNYETSPLGLTVDLVNGVGYGPSGSYAVGDTYANIENVRGSEFDDILIGTTGVNTLEGGGGTDLLIGSIGADILSGGAGIDSFAISSVSEGGDIIVDFDPFGEVLDLSSLFAAHGLSTIDPIGDGTLVIRELPGLPGNTEVAIDLDGFASAASGAATLYTLVNVAFTDITLGLDVLVA